MSVILRAARFAKAAHERQCRKWSGDAYILHPGRVASRVSLLVGATEDMVAAAWLHDVLEDTTVEAADLRFTLGEKVTQMVIALTNPSTYPIPSPLPRDQRKKIDREHLAKQSPEIKKIKMLDRIDNLRDMPGAEYCLKHGRETVGMADMVQFKHLYAVESLLLVGAIGDADELLKDELTYWADKMEREAKQLEGA